MFLICQDRGIQIKFNYIWFFCVSYWKIKFNPIFICLSCNMFLIKPFEEISPPCEKVFFYPFRIKFKTLLWYFGMSFKKYLILCSLELSLSLSAKIWCRITTAYEYNPYSRAIFKYLSWSHLGYSVEYSHLFYTLGLII